MAFNYSITEKEGLVFLEMKGRLVDKAEAIDIGADVEEQMTLGRNYFVIDLSELEYIFRYKTGYCFHTERFM